MKLRNTTSVITHIKDHIGNMTTQSICICVSLDCPSNLSLVRDNYFCLSIVQDECDLVILWRRSRGSHARLLGQLQLSIHVRSSVTTHSDWTLRSPSVVQRHTWLRASGNWFDKHECSVSNTDSVLLSRVSSLFLF